MKDSTAPIPQPQHGMAAPPTRGHALTICLPTVAAILILAFAYAFPRIFGRSTFWILLPGFYTESILLFCSLTVSAGLTKGRLARFGFTRGSFRLTPRFFLWILPMLVVTTLQVVGSSASSSSRSATLVPGSPLAIILTVWIYASICEEAFVRGLYQSWLSPLSSHRIWLLRRWWLSVPVLLGALLFAAMHIVLWPKMGTQTLAVMFVAFVLGLIAGYYREKSGSLIPAILIHSFFDIGGTLPLWVLPMLHHRFL